MIISGVGSPGTIGPASGGKLYAFNALDAVTAQQVAAANTARTQLTFHNPGDVDVFVFPAFKQNTGSNAANSVTVAAPGGSFRVFANGGTFIATGECQGAWNALAASGSGKALTVMDSNV